MDRHHVVHFTHQPPMTILEEEWPFVASADCEWRAGRATADRWWEVRMHVRKHADGRAIVRGFCEWGTPQDLPDESAALYAAELVPVGGEIAEALSTVAATLVQDAAKAGHRHCLLHIAATAQDCMVSLTHRQHGLSKSS